MGAPVLKIILVMVCLITLISWFTGYSNIHVGINGYKKWQRRWKKLQSLLPCKELVYNVCNMRHFGMKDGSVWIAVNGKDDFMAQVLTLKADPRSDLFGYEISWTLVDATGKVHYSGSFDNVATEREICRVSGKTAGNVAKAHPFYKVAFKFGYGVANNMPYVNQMQFSDASDVKLINALAQDDFQVKMTHSAINELLGFAVPAIVREVSSQVIPKQTVKDVMDLSIGPIHVETFNLNMALLFNQTAQIMYTKISNLSISFYPFPFVVEKQLTNIVGLTCNTLISAYFTEWNFAFTITPKISDECSFELIIDEESIAIDTGSVDVSIAYFSNLCDDSFSTADYLLDIEKNIKTQIVEQMPGIITDELQSGINDGLKETQSIDQVELGLCYHTVEITDKRFSLSGDFLIEEEEKQTTNAPVTTGNGTVSTTKAPEEIEQFSNAQALTPADYKGAVIPILFVVFVAISFGVGVGIAALIGYCVYLPKFKQMREDDDSVEQALSDEVSAKTTDSA